MGWQVIHVRPRGEKKLAKYCTILDIEHYLPLRAKTKIFQRRKVTTYIPLFPGYIFTCITPEQATSLKKTDLTVRFILPESEDDLMDSLDQIKMAITVDPSLGEAEDIKKGKRVRIISGPFAGIEGEVASLKGNIKVMLNVDIIGKAASVETTRDCIEVID
jgi:transcription antitermination factor NusG